MSNFGVYFFISICFVISCFAQAQNYESEFEAQEKDFARSEEAKRQYAEQRRQGLEDFLRKKEAEEAQKNADREAWLSQKYNDRAPASLEDQHAQDDLRREYFRHQNEKARQNHIDRQLAREAAREKMRRKYKSADTYRRDREPWQ